MNIKKIQIIVILYLLIINYVMIISMDNSNNFSLSFYLPSNTINEFNYENLDFTSDKVTDIHNSLPNKMQLYLISTRN